MERQVRFSSIPLTVGLECGEDGTQGADGKHSRAALLKRACIVHVWATIFTCRLLGFAYRIEGARRRGRDKFCLQVLSASNRSKPTSNHVQEP